MAGTKIGGKKAAAKNLAKNPNFYRDIGRIGGKMELLADSPLIQNLLELLVLRVGRFLAEEKRWSHDCSS